MRLSVPQALAVRRAALAAAVLLATLAAHRLTAGDLDVVPAAAATWGSLVVLAGLASRPAAAHAPRGVAGWLPLLVAGQAAAHAVMSAAPWAFGLRVHHQVAAVSVTAVLVHAVAALLLAVALARLDRALARATAVLRAAAAVVGRLRSRSAPGRTTARVAPCPPCRPRPPLRPAVPARGPPVVA